MSKKIEVFTHCDVRFHSRTDWELLADLVFMPTREVVKKGFRTDFASIPKIFHSLLSPFGSYGKAAIFHDEGYVNATVRNEAERKRIDDRFKMMMKADGVGWFLRTLIYGRVRHFGALVFYRKRASQ